MPTCNYYKRACKREATHGRYCLEHYLRYAGNMAQKRATSSKRNKPKPCTTSFKNGYEKLARLIPSDMICPMCGKTMSIGDFRAHNVMSLDCIDQDIGYVDGNVWFICLDCNQYKGSMSPYAVEDYAQRLIKAVNKHKDRVANTTGDICHTDHMTFDTIKQRHGMRQ